MRRRVLGDNKILKGTIVEGNYQVGNLVLYDKTLGEKIVIDLDSPSQEFPLSAYVPLAVIVIPSSHDVYGTGQAAAMSLLSMSYSTPNSGANTEQTMYWGNYGTDIPTLTNYNQVEHLGLVSGNVVNETIQGSSNYGYLPMMRDAATKQKEYPYDEGTYYCGTSSSYGYCPSPYNSDGSRNSLYYDTSKTEVNALSDFNGPNNTQILCDLATAQPNWKTDASITNNSGANYSPAACCCWRFCPEGTNQGDWYLPACGELGYMIPRFQIIQNSIKAVLDAGLEDFAVLLDESGYYWSSTEYSSGSARYVGASGGYVDNFNKGNYSRVRAFLRVPSAS